MAHRYMPEFFIIIITVAVTGCSADRDVVGSCKTAKLDDQSVICIDYYDAKNLDQWRSACETVIQGEWASMECDTTTAWGGCEAGNKVIWMYPSMKHRNALDAEQHCAATNRRYVPVPAG
ncbi:MAG: hypothetical protein L0Z73_07730 [Gammaproteobacteria bacterium]|nr:hypothetical protein [Gammaproteobacteria bacterium]